MAVMFAFRRVKYTSHVLVGFIELYCMYEISNIEVRHPRCVGSIAKNFFLYYTVQSNTTIFHLVVH